MLTATLILSPAHAGGVVDGGSAGTLEATTGGTDSTADTGTALYMDPGLADSLLVRVPLTGETPPWQQGAAGAASTDTKGSTDGYVAIADLDPSPAAPVFQKLADPVAPADPATTYPAMDNADNGVNGTRPPRDFPMPPDGTTFIGTPPVDAPTVDGN
jgi:hypothetical protein